LAFGPCAQPHATGCQMSHSQSCVHLRVRAAILTKTHLNARFTSEVLARLRGGRPNGEVIEIRVASAGSQLAAGAWGWRLAGASIPAHMPSPTIGALLACDSRSRGEPTRQLTLPSHPSRSPVPPSTSCSLLLAAPSLDPRTAPHNYLAAPPVGHSPSRRSPRPA